MPISFQPQPYEGQGQQVLVNSVPLTLVPGTYHSYPAKRFGDKLSIGPIKYSDFNVYENAQASAQFDGGYGLRRYADFPDEQQGLDMYFEGTNVDARFGYVTLAPLVVVETLPGSTAPVVWFGEFTPSAGTVTGARWVAVAGTKIYYRASSGVWTDSGYALASAAVQGAIGVFGGQLVIGYGSAATAQATTSLDGVVALTNVTNGAANQFVFAFTSDRASMYIAGGTASTNSNQVLSGTTTTNFGGAFTCTGADNPITSLAPGGNTALVFVGRQKELGQIAFDQIANGAIYRTLVPYDSNLSTNSRGLRWWLGSGSDFQRGPSVLFFPRDRSLWTYSPSTTSGGTAANISPWSRHGLRPKNIRGIPTAIQGTARWLYYAITNGSGHSWVLATDMSAASQASRTHSLLDLGTNACNALGVTSLFGTNPLFFCGSGNNVGKFILPLDGETPQDDANATYAATGTLDMPDVDVGFPDEDKIAFTIRVVADSLAAGAQSIDVWTALDGAAYTKLGTASSSPSTEIQFPTNTRVKRLAPRFVLNTTSPALSPVLLAFSVRTSINPKDYRIWDFEAYLPGTGLPTGSQDLQNTQTVISSFWTAYDAGYPVTYTDRYNVAWLARLLYFDEKEIEQQPLETPYTKLTFKLLSVSLGAGNSLYDNSLAIYDAPYTLYA